MNDSQGSVTAARLQELVSEANLDPLDPGALAKFDTYLQLILLWNRRTNLTAVRDTEGILSRHFVESIACAAALPDGIGTLLDFGSGAGFPGLPIAICRPGISVVLAESQNKKATFLREAISTLGLNVTLHSGRAETLQREFDCVTLRAVDQMEKALLTAITLVRPGGILALMTTVSEFGRLDSRVAALGWQEEVALPNSEQRVLRIGRKPESMAK